MSALSERPVPDFTELEAPLAASEAVAEADRCLECGGPYAEAPCTLACPAGIDVPTFVAAIARNDVDAAADTIFAENLLGGTCARVCPVEMLCAGACVLPHDGSRPIEIGRLQRYATDAALADGRTLRRRAPHNWFRVAVIGAGPAGLVCAGELAALGYSVTIYDAHPEPGGLARYAIAPYRLQQEPLPSELATLISLGVSFELGLDIDTPEMLSQVDREADVVVLAIGMGADTDAGLQGHELVGVWNSLPFIEALKTRSAPTVGKTVAVIGGGNTAIDVARESVRLGAEVVTLLYRRTRAEMPAYPHEVEEAEAEGVQFEWLAVPIRFVGDVELEGVECRHARLGPPDDSGRRRPEPIPGSEFVVPADTAINAIGQQPRREFLDWIEGLELERGCVKVDAETGQTTNPKYFAAGDATNGGATVVEAVRQAKIVARGVDGFIRKEHAA